MNSQIELIENDYKDKISDQQRQEIVTELRKIDKISIAIYYCKTLGMTVTLEGMIDEGRFASDILKAIIDERLRDPDYL